MRVHANLPAGLPKVVNPSRLRCGEGGWSAVGPQLRTACVHACMHEIAMAMHAARHPHTHTHTHSTASVSYTVSYKACTVQGLYA